jgi:diguanylate cyclase (GGDEF)-like protein
MLATCGERNTKTGLGPDAELHLEAGRAIDAVTVGKVAEAGVQRQLAIERVFVIGPAVRPASADATPCPIALIGEIDAGKVNLRTIEEFVIEVGEPVDIAACHPAGTVLPDTEVTDMSLPCRAVWQRSSTAYCQRICCASYQPNFQNPSKLDNKRASIPDASPFKSSGNDWAHHSPDFCVVLSICLVERTTSAISVILRGFLFIVLLGILVPDFRHFDDEAVAFLPTPTTSPVSLLVVDIDHFKSINDTLGHEAGDHVLTAFGCLLLETLSQIGICGRLGGEEFVVLVPNCNASSARAIAERLRHKVRDNAFDGLPGTWTVTISLGVAEARSHETLAELIARADAALYAAKLAGRDCIKYSA